MPLHPEVAVLVSASETVADQLALVAARLVDRWLLQVRAEGDVVDRWLPGQRAVGLRHRRERSPGRVRNTGGKAHLPCTVDRQDRAWHAYDERARVHVDGGVQAGKRLAGCVNQAGALCRQDEGSIDAWRGDAGVRRP